MYYTDSEIYYAIRRGVEIEVLADLNGCQKSEITQAAARYTKVLNDRDAEYNNLTANKTATPKHNYLPVSRRRLVMSYNQKQRFNYSDELLASMEERIASGKSTSEIYKELIEDAGIDNPPSKNGFSTRCRKIRNKLAETDSSSKGESSTPSSTISGASIDLSAIQSELSNKLDIVIAQNNDIISMIDKLNKRLDECDTQIDEITDQLQALVDSNY